MNEEEFKKFDEEIPNYVSGLLSRVVESLLSIGIIPSKSANIQNFKIFVVSSQMTAMSFRKFVRSEERKCDHLIDVTKGKKFAA